MEQNIPEVSIYFDHDATVVTLPETEYGSLDQENIDRISGDLVEVADETPTRHLILDLTLVAYYGAAFLGAVVRANHELSVKDKQLIVCGECWGLMPLTHLDHLVPTFSTLQDALNWCPSSQKLAACVSMSVGNHSHANESISAETFGSDKKPIR